MPGGPARPALRVLPGPSARQGDVQRLPGALSVNTTDFAPRDGRARKAIQRQEEERVLSVLPDADRAAFIRALRILSELPPEDMRG